MSAVAGVALAVPVVLLVAGLHKQLPIRAEAATVKPVKVVRVTKVVRPVTVKRVVEQAAPVQQAAPAPVPPRTTEKPAPKRDRTVVGRPAPVVSQPEPETPAESAPDSAP